MSSSSSSSSSSFRYLLAYFVLIIYLQSVDANTNLSFVFKNFGKDSNFESQLALYGDATLANDSMSLQLAGSGASRAGTIIYKKPINLVEINSGNLVSFSNLFVFNVSGERGGGFTFLVLPFGFLVDAFGGGSMGDFGERGMKFFSLEIYATRDHEGGTIVYDHEGGNHLEIKVGVELNSGEMLQAWIDYESSGKGLKVRFSKLSNTKSDVPLYTLFHHVDLGMMWKGETTVAIGLSSSHMINLYSWSFRPRNAPQWMHSEPVDPEGLMRKIGDVKVAKCYACSLTRLLALILGVGFAAILVGFLVFQVWTMLGCRRPVVPEEFTVPAKESEFKKCVSP